MITVDKKMFVLETNHTTYVFSILPSGHLEHLHYGTRIAILDQAPLVQKNAFVPGNMIQYSEAHPTLALENMTLEVGTLGKGDVRDPFVDIAFQDGSRTLDFIYDSHEVTQGKQAYESFPGAYGEDDAVETLIVHLTDSEGGIRLDLMYHVFSESDVIVRSSRIINSSKAPVILERLMSTQLDFDHNSYEKITFTGAWAREMEKHRQSCEAGMLVNSSLSGVSSNRTNPFFIIASPSATETQGECYGFNLVYSGDHYSMTQVGSHGKLRVLLGINPLGLSTTLNPGDVFQSPEAVMTYSERGFEDLSHHMHRFVKNHIVRGVWKNKPRPILINSWEATYFDFTERKLLKLAETAKKTGIELFVLDDGWFGKRNDDQSSLGDWYVNLKKLPGGLEGLSKHIHDMGLMFGVWVEPEMVSEDSDCFRTHPEWAVRISWREHSKGRNQMILDLANPEVQSFVIESMSTVFSSAEVDYVKWDMNRIFSDFHSAHKHKYILGLYRILDELTTRFPNILFEGCASGGNRFDLGMLCYMPQLWASDNTDAISRIDIQKGYSYGYPQSVLGAHVSDCPNHQTLRSVPLETRFNVAAFGLLGYECNLSDFSKDQLLDIQNQIDLYKKWRETFQYGNLYRLESPFGEGTMVVSQDQKTAVAAIYQKKAVANKPDYRFVGRGLDPNMTYSFYNMAIKQNVKRFGDLINMVSPIHIKNGSAIQDLVSKFYKLEGEKESYQVSGSLLMGAGIKLKQGFMGMGYNEEVRLFQDFDSRLYFMEAIEG